ncbi:helix-turn-helix transcriptional regulator [Streptomyces sp. NPDC056373]|uniref:helix-turn-helix domain-containing protein n=1 Tax=Streptomyces sp. NPDC056373 TaxID=3345798 RepID=UPI0035E0F64E
MPIRIETLTSRERQVLSLLPTGMTNRRLAAELGVAERTIRAHLAHIVRKLDVESRVAAAVVADRHRDILLGMGDMPDAATPEEAISRSGAHVPGS